MRNAQQQEQFQIDKGHCIFLSDEGSLDYTLSKQNFEKFHSPENVRKILRKEIMDKLYPLSYSDNMHWGYELRQEGGNSNSDDWRAKYLAAIEKVEDIVRQFENGEIKVLDLRDEK